MRRIGILSAVAVSVVIGGAVLISAGCGDGGTGPGESNACETLHFGDDGRSLWGNCCGSGSRLIGLGVLSATTNCWDDEGCSDSWSVTVTRAPGSGVITSYVAVYNNKKRCVYP